jgi:hypothetical protein
MSAFGGKADTAKKGRAGQVLETEFNWAVGRLRRERKLPQRDHQPVEVGGDDQSHLAARQRQHRAVLVGQYDPARAGTDRNARAGSAVYAIHVERTSDVADLTDKIGR